MAKKKTAESRKKVAKRASGLPADYANLLSNLKERIASAQVKAAIDATDNNDKQHDGRPGPDRGHPAVTGGDLLIRYRRILGSQFGPDEDYYNKAEQRHDAGNNASQEQLVDGCFSEQAIEDEQHTWRNK